MFNIPDKYYYRWEELKRRQLQAQLRQKEKDDRLRAMIRWLR